MKATIRLTNLSNSTTVLKRLVEVINSHSSLQKQLIENGVYFAELSSEEIKTLIEQLTKHKYSTYQVVADSVHLNVDSDSTDGLIKILVRVLGQEPGLVKMLWMKGLTLIANTVDQANDLKKSLEQDEGVEVIIVATSQFQFVVSGQVIRNDNTSFGDSGYSVQAFDKVDSINTIPLGAPFTLQADGTYRSSYTWESTDGLKGPNLIVRLYNPEGKVVAENNIPYASRQETLNLVIDLPVPLQHPTAPDPIPNNDPFIVSGTIQLANGSKLSGIIVRAFDRDMRSEEPLGEMITDTQGSYEISYMRDQFQRAEKKRADLLIRVMDVHGIELGVSETIFNAEPLQTLDLTLSPDQYQWRSEYDRYIKELAPLIENVNIAELTDEDLQFLTGETGISAEHLNFLRLVMQWSAQRDIDPAVFYGLFRQALSTNYRRLLAQKPSRLCKALKTSLEQNIIPAALGSRLDEILDRLEELAIADAFEQPGASDQSTV